MQIVDGFSANAIGVPAFKCSGVRVFGCVSVCVRASVRMFDGRKTR